MKIVIAFIVGVCFGTFSNAQNITPKLLGFEHHVLQSTQLDEINYYLSLDSATIQKPLLVYLDGSGALPLFQEIEAGIGSTVVIDFQKLQNEFRILLISKPGVPFVDKVKDDLHGFPQYQEPNSYIEKLSLEWRAQSAHEIIERLIIESKIDSSKIVVFGFSEGAQVAPKLAVLNDHITHLLLFGGNGLNQFFDPIINARLRSSRGEITELEAQLEIDSLFKIYADIYNNPDSTDKNWWGHTYKRWASFTQTDPYKYLLEIDFPIYIANGSLDENSILSADYIQLEFIKNRKSNLTYKTYANCDHQFNEIITKKGQFIESKSKIGTVLNEAFDWLKNQ